MAKLIKRLETKNGSTKEWQKGREGDKKSSSTWKHYQLYFMLAWKYEIKIHK